MATPTYITAAETRAEARAMLLAPVTDADHVEADLHESRGKLVETHRARNLPSFTGDDHEDFEIDRKHLPPTLRGINVWMLLVEAYSDEETAAVLGHEVCGVSVSAITVEVFGTNFVDWCQVRYAPRRTQQALAMLIVAELRDRRCVSRVAQHLAR